MLYAVPWDWVLVVLGIVGVGQALLSIVRKRRRLVHAHELKQEVFSLVLSGLLLLASGFETAKQAGRHLWPWQRVTLINSLQNNCESVIYFFYDDEDPEASQYFEELRDAMRAAGAKVDFADNIFKRRRDQVPVDLGFGFNPNDVCSQQFVDAFKKAGIDVVLDRGADYDIGKPQMFIGSDNSPHALPVGKWTPPP